MFGYYQRYLFVPTFSVLLFETLLKNTNRQQYNMFIIPTVLIKHGNPRVFTI